MANMDQFIKDNAKWLLILLFSAGMLYSEIKDFNLVEENLTQEIKTVKEAGESEVKIVEARLSKKIKIIQDNEEKIHALEIRIVKLETKNCK
jgi:hypothetical protein